MRFFIQNLLYSITVPISTQRRIQRETPPKLKISTPKKLIDKTTQFIGLFNCKIPHTIFNLQTRYFEHRTLHQISQKVW